MTESRPSKAQERFLKNEKRHHLLVGSARFLVFFLFAGLWELSADLGMIDSFIFSSPSRIVLCFYTMTMDKSIFLHIGITFGVFGSSSSLDNLSQRPSGRGSE